MEVLGQRENGSLFLGKSDSKAIRKILVGEGGLELVR